MPAYLEKEFKVAYQPHYISIIYGSHPQFIVMTGHTARTQYA